MTSQNLSSLCSDAEDLELLRQQVLLETLTLPDRLRRLRASLVIPAPAERIWQVLTDYDRLAEFIPNLSISRRLPHPEGGVRLEQVGSQCFLSLKFCARVVLDMEEQPLECIGFRMVEGDFRRFEGEWRLLSHPTGTQLDYCLVIGPKLAMPIGLIEKHLSDNLSTNLAAIARQTQVQGVV